MPNTNLFIPEDLNIALKIIAEKHLRSVKKEILYFTNQMVADYLSEHNYALEEIKLALNGVRVESECLREILTQDKGVSTEENLELKKEDIVKKDQSAESD